MVRLNLNKVEGALEDAKKCLELDASFVKAYHRKSQALLRLGEFDQAIQAAEAGGQDMARPVDNVGDIFVDTGV